MEVQTSPFPSALLVDPDADTLQLYSDYLGYQGYRVHTAADGRIGLSKAIAEVPDVIITETVLPGIDGFRLIELLRSDAELGAVPIIVLTGDARPASIERADTAGANTVLIKPCLPDALLREVHDVRQRSSRLRARSQVILSHLEETLVRTAKAIGRSQSLSKSFRRFTTTNPPLPPPAVLFCPKCDAPLKYRRSYVGGVNEKQPEQWDEFLCPKACGSFRYRHRTRRLSDAR